VQYRLMTGTDINPGVPFLHYRPEIDGLRAIAVVAVIAFHLNISGVPGGYFGVDVFFVISGYLLTGIIAREMSAGQFSIAGFYARRIRRIVPALVVLLALSIAIGFALLTPGDYETMAQSALYALFGLSNFFFFNNTGYFDAASNTMPLLHTWSLGVEEQFYLIWPLFAVIAWKITRGRRTTMLAVFGAFAAASAALYVIAVSQNTNAAFYLPQNRAWELAIGGCLALLTDSQKPEGSRSWLADAVALLGLLAIVVSVAVVPSAVTWRSYYVALPVIGSAALIWGSQRGTILGRVLSLPPFTFTGKISYSLYLYHWPLIVFWGHSTNFEALTNVERAGIASATAFLSWLSWRFVERPFRVSRTSKRTVFATALAAQGAVATVCLAVVWTQGVPQRIPQSVQSMRSLQVMWEWDCPNQGIPFGRGCVVGRAWDKAAHRVMLWGDSNGWHTGPILNGAIGSKDIAGFAFGECAPIARMGQAEFANAERRYLDHCENHRRDVIDHLKQDGEVQMVMIAAAWGSQATSLVRRANDAPDPALGLKILEETLSQLVDEVTAPGRKIVLISEIPKWSRDPVACVISQTTTLVRLRRCDNDMGELLLSENYDIHQRSARSVLERICQSGRCSVVYPELGMCRDGRCVTVIGGEFLYRDSGHVRRNLSDQTQVELAKKFGLTALMESLAEDHDTKPKSTMH
jgi:peptidoglycan/LPS O-acetylase OafA/YrhL